MTWDLWLGDWQRAMAHVEAVDLLLSDPPYADKTHAGFRSSKTIADEKRRARSSNGAMMPARRNEMPYEPLTEAQVIEFVEFWSTRVRWWVVLFGDHFSARWWERHWGEAGWLVFHPIPWIKPNGAPRFQGDGPANSAEWLTIARPRHKLPKDRNGSRPGWYRCNQVHGTSNDKVITGQKPLELMQALVRDYSNEGDLICDPFAGSGTTGRACQTLTRNFIGCERDPNTHAKAHDRMLGRGSSEEPGGQLGMFR